MADTTNSSMSKQAQQPAKMNAVPFTQVRISDRFWSPRREVNRKISLLHSLEMLESTGTIHNFDLAANHARTDYAGPVFVDSDLYKTLEAVSYSLATDPDPTLESRVDGIIAQIAAAQRPNGYLDTYYEVNEPDKTFTNLRDNHELYCAGHLFEASVAHFQATGKRTLLNIATKYADLLTKTFGEGPGRRMGYPGHPEIELALVKLWRATGEQRYFDLARFFIENRGRKFFAQEHGIPPDRFDGTYWLDDVPIREHRTIKGHAVRATYLMSGVVDVASETGDKGLLQMVDRVWRNTTQKRMYVTGGIGPSASNEGFTTDYDLPNLTAYQETCASVAMAMWNHRLNLMTGEARYADMVELALYNGILAGVSLDGKKFFYVNPLESRGDHHRSQWFGCACCPPNAARTLSSLGNYAYATTDDSLYVNLYVQGSVAAEIGGRRVSLDVTTDYPWDGLVRITPTVGASAKFALRLRVPGWCEGAAASVNGENVANAPIERGYLVLNREWSTGDRVDLHLPMPARRVEAHPLVTDDLGKTALQRGPLVYCLEACDNEVPLNEIALPYEEELTPEKRQDLLGGVVVLKGHGIAASEEQADSHTLYKTARSVHSVPIVAVPYYAWDNRKAGAMQVWLPTTLPTPKVGGPETAAEVSLSFVSGNCQPWGINDGIEPKSSGEQPAALCHWWPHKGGDEWAQYSWKKPMTVAGVRVYWFDDTGRGECRLPQAWKILYREGDTWKPVQAESGYKVQMDRWCEVIFAPVTATAMRLVVTMQPRWAAGVHEWKILTPEDE